MKIMENYLNETQESESRKMFEGWWMNVDCPLHLF